MKNSLKPLGERVRLIAGVRSSFLLFIYLAAANLQLTRICKKYRYCHTKMATKAIKFTPALKEIRLHLCQKSSAR
jgi:hypothetical protein